MHAKQHPFHKQEPGKKALAQLTTVPSARNSTSTGTSAFTYGIDARMTLPVTVRPLPALPLPPLAASCLTAMALLLRVLPSTIDLNEVQQAHTGQYVLVTVSVVQHAVQHTTTAAAAVAAAAGTDAHVPTSNCRTLQHLPLLS
jgi:hypothetical protein